MVGKCLKVLQAQQRIFMDIHNRILDGVIIMSIITRNIKGKLIALAVGLVVFIGLHLLSVTALKGVYLFEWLAQERYCYYILAVVIVLIFFDQTLVSYFVTFGTVFGAFVGQYLGDYLREQNMAKITPDMSNEMVYHLSCHQGAFIFAGIVLGFAVVGIICKIVSSAFRRHKSRSLSQKDEQ